MVISAILAINTSVFGSVARAVESRRNVGRVR